MTEVTIGELISFLNQFGEHDEDVAIELKPEHRDDTLRDLGFDSLGIFNTTTQISESFDIELPYDEVATARTLGDLLTVVNRAISSK